MGWGQARSWKAGGAGAAILVCVTSSAGGEEMTTRQALRHIETYTFVLPAIDCYRDTASRVTTDRRALSRLIDGTAKLAEKDGTAMKAAATRGARRYEALVGWWGRAAYCKRVVREFGPRGTVHKGLIVDKR